MTNERELLNRLLAKPVGKNPIPRQAKDTDFTKRVEVSGDMAEVELRGATAAEVDDSAAAEFLRSKGEDPSDWVPTGFRASEWTMPGGGQGESVRYTFVRKGAAPAARENIDELLTSIDHWAYDHSIYEDQQSGDHTFIVAIGDMQFGKIDGDGPEGTLTRLIDYINRAALLLHEMRKRFDIGHVHIAWLGDHIEGFLSQGGANVWRTVLTLTEQIRLTRRVMLHAMLTFAPLVERLTMAAVPGNHGETVRFSGKGTTRYDDSHDTECLIAVKDAAELNPELFGHVEFYVPDTDEMIVVVECSGTVVGHVHGHQFRENKHFDWWEGQAFSRESPMHMVDLLLAGHLHHEHIETNGPRTFAQVPSPESESTWYRHNKGTKGSPGILTAITKDGRTNLKEVIN